MATQPKDNNYTAGVFQGGCEQQGIALLYMQPGKPDQNAFIERFNRSYRNEVLNLYVFDDIEQVQQLTDEWLHSYNPERLHDSLGRVPPLTFMPKVTNRQSVYLRLST